MTKEAVVPPAGIVTLEGTVSWLPSVDSSWTTSAAGAAGKRLTLPAIDVPSRRRLVERLTASWAMSASATVTLVAALRYPVAVAETRTG